MSTTVDLKNLVIILSLVDAGDGVLQLDLNLQSTLLLLIRLNSGVRTINNNLSINGNFLILGSLCISVVTSTDPDAVVEDDTRPDTQTIPTQPNSITIFDGCLVNVPTCQDVLDLYYRIYSMYYWLLWLKNCVLYINNSKDSSTTLDSTFFPKIDFPKITNCELKPVIAPLYWMLGIELLNQYKAVVAVWNYFVNQSSLVKVITTTPEDFAGIDITLKKSFDLCSLSSSQLLTKTLTINVSQIQPQELPSQPADLKKDLLWIGSGHIYLFACMNGQNTYILLGTDRGSTNVSSLSLLVYSTLNGCFTQVALEGLGSIASSVVYNKGASVDSIACSIIFKVTGGSSAVLSGSLKVIPVWSPHILGSSPISGAAYPYDAFTDLPVPLELFVNTRPHNVLLSTSLQLKKVKWKVAYSWDSSQYKTLLYLSSYTRYFTRVKLE